MSTHAFPLHANARQRRTVLTNDTQKIKRVPDSVSGARQKSPWKSQGLLNTKPWGNRCLQIPPVS